MQVEFSPRNIFSYRAISRNDINLFSTYPLLTIATNIGMLRQSLQQLRISFSVPGGVEAYHSMFVQHSMTTCTHIIWTHFHFSSVSQADSFDLTLAWHCLLLVLRCSMSHAQSQMFYNYALALFLAFLSLSLALRNSHISLISS